MAATRNRNPRSRSVKMTQAERETLRASNRANNKAYHHARKWYNIESLAAPLRAVRRKLR